MEIELESKRQRLKKGDTDVSATTEADVPSRQHSKTSVSRGEHSVQWHSADNLLLYNYRNSFKDDQFIPLGTFLGDSLALVNFSVLDDTFDRAYLTEFLDTKPHALTVFEYLESKS
jgi:hypothetical protein